MIRFLSLIAFSLSSTFAFADSCESSYRAAYASNRDAEEIYKIYTDAEVGVEEAYIEALPLFDALKIDQDQQSGVLAQVVWMMKSGQLCKPNGATMTLSEAAAALKAKR